MGAYDSENMILLRIPLAFVEAVGAAPTTENLLALAGAVYRAYTRNEPHLVPCARNGCPNEFVRKSFSSLKRYCSNTCAVRGHRVEVKNKAKYEAALDRIQKKDKENINAILGD